MKRMLSALLATVVLISSCLVPLPVSAKENYTEYIVPFYSDQTKQKQVVGISNKSLLKKGVVLIPLETACEIAGATIAEENNKAVIITRNYVSWCCEYKDEKNQYLLIDSNTGKGNFYKSALKCLIESSWSRTSFNYSLVDGVIINLPVDSFNQTKIIYEYHDNELYVSFYEFLVMMGVNVELINHEAINKIKSLYTSMIEQYSNIDDYKTAISEIGNIITTGTGYGQFFYCSLGTPIDELYKTYYNSDIMCDLGDYYGDGSVEWANFVNAIENYDGFTKTALAALNLNTDYEEVLINVVTYHGDSEDDDFSKEINAGINMVNSMVSVNELGEIIEDATKKDNALQLAWDLQQNSDDFNPVLSYSDVDLGISKDSKVLSGIGKTCSIIESARKYRELEDLFEIEETLLENTLLSSYVIEDNVKDETKVKWLSPRGIFIKMHNNLRNKENSYFNLYNSANKVQRIMKSSCSTVIGVIYDTIINEVADKADEKILKSVDKLAFRNIPVTQLANAGIKCAGNAISNTAYGKEQSDIAELDDYVFLQEVAEGCFKEHSPASENARSSFILGLKSTMLAFESTSASSSGEIHGGGGISFDSGEKSERKGYVPEELYGLLDQSVTANVDFYNAFPNGCDDLTEMLGGNTDISKLDISPRQDITIKLPLHETNQAEIFADVVIANYDMYSDWFGSYDECFQRPETTEISFFDINLDGKLELLIHLFHDGTGRLEGCRIYEVTDKSLILMYETYEEFVNSINGIYQDNNGETFYLCEDTAGGFGGYSTALKKMNFSQENIEFTELYEAINWFQTDEIQYFENGELISCSEEDYNSKINKYMSTLKDLHLQYSSTSSFAEMSQKEKREFLIDSYNLFYYDGYQRKANIEDDFSSKPNIPQSDITANTAEILESGRCGADGDNLTWSLDNEGTLRISGEGDMDDFPFDTSPWFWFMEKIKNIVIENGVTSIGEFGFSYCSFSTSIIIPESVTSIGHHAFSDCTALDSITIPESVISIGAQVFDDTPWLEEQRKKNPLVIVNGILIDGTNCEGDVMIPNSVTSIGHNAFSDCTALDSITIPESVTSIGHYAFSGCTALDSITIPESDISIGYGAFDSTPWLEEQRRKNPLVIVNGILIDGENCKGSVVIPYNVTSIGDYAFSYCDSLTSIIVPNNVTSIGDYAFSYCDSLTSIIVPNNVTSIGDFAFTCCDSLTSITIPDSVTSIGYGAFYDCKGLTSITIPDSVTSIGYSAFFDCTSLTSVTIPDSVTSIGYSAFFDCTSLTSVTIPDSVTSIGYGAFDSTPWLEEQRRKNPLVIVNGILIDGVNCKGSVAIPNSVTNIGDFAFTHCDSLTSITIPDSVTNIGVCAFYDCKGLTSITIPDSVTNIGDCAFYDCKGLTSITIPDSVTSIGYSAFFDCTSLTSVTIPDSVTSIGDSAFSECTALDSITIPENVISIGYEAFGDCINLSSITIENPECKICGFEDTICNNYDAKTQKKIYTGKIYGYKDSTAQAYAEKYNIKFVSLAEK